MSGSTPLGGAVPEAVLANVVDRLVAKELASLAADAKNLRELVAPGEVLVATVRPSNGLTDILEILGNRVAAALPPNLTPGDTIAVRVTGFDGERIVLQNLGPIAEEEIPVPGTPQPAPPPPQAGSVSFISDAPATPPAVTDTAAPIVPEALAPEAFPTAARRTVDPQPSPVRDLTASNVIPLPRDGSGGREQTRGREQGAPREQTARAPQPSQEELRTRFPFDTRLSRIVIGPQAAASAPLTPPVPASPAGPDKLSLLHVEFGDLPDRFRRPDDGLPRVAIDAALLAKRPPTVPVGAELVESVQQELFADIAGAFADTSEDPSEALRSAPLPPPVRGDVAIPRPLHGDGIPVPSVPDREGLAAPPSVPRQVVPLAPGRPVPPEPSAPPTFIAKRPPAPTDSVRPLEARPPAGELEARIAAARATSPLLPLAPGPKVPVAPTDDVAKPHHDGTEVPQAPRAGVPQRLPDAPPVITQARSAPIRPAAPRVPEPIRNQPEYVVPREPAALLKALGLPVTATAVAAARLALDRPEAVPTALVALERALPAGDQRTATLRTIVGFIARLDPAAPTFSAQLAAYVEHVVRGPEPLLREIAVAERATGAATEASTDAEASPTIPSALVRSTLDAPSGFAEPRAPGRAAGEAVPPPSPASAGTSPDRGAPAAAADTIASLTQAAESTPVAEPVFPAGAARLETVALARVAERANAADAQLKTQIARVLGIAALDPSVAAATPALHEALAAVTAQQIASAPLGTNVSPNVVEFAIPLPRTGPGHVARVRIERDERSPHAKIDGDDFRIALVLDTKHFGTVAIDLAAVGRSVEVGVKTEAARGAEAFAAALDGLRARLTQLHYTVASARAGVAGRESLPARAWPPPAPGAPRDPNALVDRDA